MWERRWTKFANFPANIWCPGKKRFGPGPGAINCERSASTYTDTILCWSSFSLSVTLKAKCANALLGCGGSIMRASACESVCVCVQETPKNFNLGAVPPPGAARTQDTFCTENFFIWGASTPKIALGPLVCLRERERVRAAPPRTPNALARPKGHGGAAHRRRPQKSTTIYSLSELLFQLVVVTESGAGCRHSHCELYPRRASTKRGGDDRCGGGRAPTAALALALELTWEPIWI